MNKDQIEAYQALVAKVFTKKEIELWRSGGNSDKFIRSLAEKGKRLSKEFTKEE